MTFKDLSVNEVKFLIEILADEFNDLLGAIGDCKNDEEEQRQVYICQCDIITSIISKLREE